MNTQDLVVISLLLSLLALCVGALVFLVLLFTGSLHKVVHIDGPTQYRSVSWRSYLEYAHYWKFLGITSRTVVWSRVPRPFYDMFHGRGDISGIMCADDICVNGGNTDVNRFVKDYPDIRVYFAEFDAKQRECEERAAEELRKFNERQSSIKNLT